MKTKITALIIASLALGALLLAACSDTKPSGNKEHSGHAQHEQAQTELYRCPMHPQYTSEQPGECPICGMDLVPVKQQEETDMERRADLPPGLGMVSLDKTKRQLIGIKTTAVERKPLTKTVRAAAIVKPDRRLIRQVNTKFHGWIEKLFVDFTGQFVEKGEEMLSIYSPELVSTQGEYLLALKNLRKLADAPPYVRQSAAELARASKRRLEYWDIPGSEISKLKKTGRPRKALTLESPVTGYVTHLNAVEGMEVKPGDGLYRIADLSRVWVMAEVHERDLGWVKVGMKANFIPDSNPGKRFEGKATYIDPELNPQTRTAGVRLELDNSDMELRPQMHGDVEIESERPETLVAPASAVMDNGKLKVVFVETEPGHYMPREVKIGLRTSNGIEIIEGIEEGEKVVVGGNFLLDSESRLRAGISGGGGHDH